MFKFCPNCTNEIKPSWKCCPYCGFKFSETASTEIGGNSALDNALGNLIGLAEERQTEDKLRTLIIRGKYDEAKRICDSLIDNDPMDKSAYIALIRIASKNYKIEPNAEVNEQIRIATEIFGEKEILENKELYDYLSKNPQSPEKQAMLAESLINEGKFAEAVKWLKKSAEDGYAHSYFVLAQLYENGTGVDKDINLALQNYTKASERGDKSAIAYFNPTEAESQYNLGLNFYAIGNYDGAKWWFEIAGRSGYNIAVYYLGLMHEDGKGFEQNRDVAYELYSSVKMGCQEAWDAVERIDKQRTEEVEIERKKAKIERAKKIFILTENKDGTYTVGSYGIAHTGVRDASITNIVIPDFVTCIYSDAFSMCCSLTSITIPNSVISIGDSAFSGCESLKSITIPKSVRSIGEDALNGCSSLNKIEVEDDNPSYKSVNNCLLTKDGKILLRGVPNGYIPDEVIRINDTAFCGYLLLRRVIIPNSVTSIGDSAFQACESLEDITIPNSVTSIGKSAFEGCESLKSITIPNNVTSIGEGTFRDCESLKSITIPNSVKSIGDYAFVRCHSLTRIIVPDSVRRIGKNAFNNCKSLNYVSIPSGCRYEGDSFQDGCKVIKR